MSNMINAIILSIFEDFFQKLILKKEELIKNNVDDKEIEKLASDMEKIIISYHASLLHEFGDEVTKETQYVMSAMTDEVLTPNKWHGISAWKNSLVEQRMFESHISGTKIFERIDELIKIRSSNIEICTIYFLCLSLNFRGTYHAHTQGNNDKLQTYKQNLFNLIINHSNSENLINTSNIKHEYKLFPKSYLYTIETVKNFKTSKRSYFVYWITIGIIMYFVTGYIIWKQHSYEVLKHTEETLLLLNKVNLS